MAQYADLQDLKRIAESFNVDTTLSGKEVKDKFLTLKGAVDEIIAGYKNNDKTHSEKHNSLVQKVEDNFNDLDARLKALSELDAEEFEQLVQDIANLRNLVGTDLIDLLQVADVVADKVNSLHRVMSLGEMVIDSNDGKKTIDLTSFNFADENAYIPHLTLRTQAPVTVQALDKTKDGFTIRLRDDEFLVSDDVDYNAEVTKDDGTGGKGNVVIAVAIAYAPRPEDLISKKVATLNETDGEDDNETEVGAGSGDAGSGSAGN